MECLINQIRDIVPNLFNSSIINLYIGKNAIGYIKQKLANQNNCKYILLSHSIEDSIIDYLEIKDSSNLIGLIDKKNKISSKYNIDYVECQTVFHSKLYIQIISNSKLNVFIGSANLTQNALQNNIESIVFMPISTNSPEYLIDFGNIIFKSISKIYTSQVIDLWKPKWLKNGVKENKFIHYIDNYNNSLLEQILNFIDNKTILKAYSYAPIYKNEGGSLLEYLYNKNMINEYFETDTFISNEYLFHIKVFIFKTSNDSIVFIGSPNNSISSFTKKGCNILENGLLIRIHH